MTAVCPFKEFPSVRRRCLPVALRRLAFNPQDSDEFDGACGIESSPTHARRNCRTKLPSRRLSRLRRKQSAARLRSATTEQPFGQTEWTSQRPEPSDQTNTGEPKRRSWPRSRKACLSHWHVAAPVFPTSFSFNGVKKIPNSRARSLEPVEETRSKMMEESESDQRR